jgi:hypothetical protein
MLIVIVFFLFSQLFSSIEQSSSINVPQVKRNNKLTNGCFELQEVVNFLRVVLIKIEKKADNCLNKVFFNNFIRCYHKMNQCQEVANKTWFSSSPPMRRLCCSFWQNIDCVFSLIKKRKICSKKEFKSLINSWNLNLENSSELFYCKEYPYGSGSCHVIKPIKSG